MLFVMIRIIYPLTQHLNWTIICQQYIYSYPPYLVTISRDLSNVTNSLAFILILSPLPFPLNMFFYANLNFFFAIHMLLPYFTNNTAILVNLHKHKEFLTIYYSFKSNARSVIHTYGI